MIIWCERNLNFFVLNTIQFLNEFDITTLPPSHYTPSPRSPCFSFAPVACEIFNTCFYE